MHTILSAPIIASLAFVGTMCDNFVTLAAQLVLTDSSRVRRVVRAQALGVVTMVALALALGFVFHAVPLRWLGLLALAPASFAVHAWHARRKATPVRSHGAAATFALTLAIGGDNLAVWSPLFRADDPARLVATLLAFAVWEVLLLAGARGLARHPRVANWGEAHLARVMWLIYAALAVLVLVECHLI